jgi:hypothetical protein
LREDGWVRVRTFDVQTFVGVDLVPADETNPCRDANGNFARTRIEALMLPEINLPVCGANQFLNCRPATACTSVFGCAPAPTNVPSAFDPLTLTEFASTEDGCNNANTNCNTPCPAWPEGDNRHCGHDVVTTADAEYAATGLRTVYAIRGGILREYGSVSSAQGNYKIRTRSGTEILEYQYTHTAANTGITTNERGEYIAAGIPLAQYIDTPQTGPTTHVHVVIKTFPIGENQENIVGPQSNDPREDDRYRDAGVPVDFYVPFSTSPEQRQNRSNPVNIPIPDVRFVARPRNSVTYIYSAAGLPPGLLIDAATGTINGTPTQVGEYSVVITAIDNRTTPREGHVRFVWMVTP